MEVCVFLADGFEMVEALAVVDILRRARVETVMVSVSDSLEVTSSHNVKFMADMIFDEEACMQAKAAFLPGGMPGTRNLEGHPGVLSVIKNFYEDGKTVAAICAAPSIFGHLGILKGKKATSHAGFVDQLEGAEFVDEPVVVADNVITSRGMGTAVELGLILAERFKGSECRDSIVKSIHYSR